MTRKRDPNRFKVWCGGQEIVSELSYECSVMVLFDLNSSNPPHIYNLKDEPLCSESTAPDFWHASKI